MKAFVVHEPCKGAYDEVELPSLLDNQILIKIKYIGICGTDFAIYSGNSSFVKSGQITYPIRMGHEWSGIVEQVGKNVSRFKKGDRVIGDNFVGCGECEACKKQDYNYCSNKFNVGTIHAWDGGFADYIVMPEHHVYKVADHVSLKHAALCEPLSVAYGAIKKLDITSESKIAIIGTGSIGMCAAALALYKGSKHVYVIGRNDYKLQVGKKLGITGVINTCEESLVERTNAITNGKGFDYVVECSGVPCNIQACIDMICSKGKIILVGFYEARIDGLDMDAAVSKEVTITGIMGEFGNIEAVNQIMAERDLKLDPIITADVSFEECHQVFEDREKNRHICIKTMIHMD